ncbi:MAG: four helix bundle protein [Bacteroidota bacterium]
MVKENIILDKSFQFALQIIETYKTLNKSNEFILSKQLLKSGTSIGANVREASAAQTKKDFIAKMSIASKEARETKYWLELLQESKIVTNDYTNLLNQNDELIKILTKIVKTSQTTI